MFSKTTARLIRKVYEADPLECPKCKGPMRVFALIEDPGVIRRILEHLGLCGLRRGRNEVRRWVPRPGPVHASQLLTYHPVPDIA